MEKIKKYLPILSVIVLSLPTIEPLLHAGIYTMHDNTQVARVYEMAIALKDGMFPVRWVPDLGYGYGYPIFNFYGPLPYYIGALLYLLVGEAIVATKYMIGIGTLLAGVTMYVLTRRQFGKNAAIAASITYMYFPYHALNLYVRGAIGETFAYAFIPLVFYGLFEISKTGKSFMKSISSILITGVAFAAVVISHNLSAFMLVLMLIPLLVVAFFFVKHKKTFVLAALSAFALGGALSAFYALPAIFEMGYTNVMSQVGGGADFRDHFVCIEQLWSGVWGFGGSAPGCIDGMSFALGKNNLLALTLVSPFVLWYILKTKKPQITFQTVSIYIILVFALFLILPLSRFVWEVVPAIEFIQFPWRFLNFIGLAISFLVAVAIWGIADMKYKTGAVIAAVIITVSQILFHQDIFAAQTYNTTPDRKYLSDANLNFNISKISDEYLPKDFDKPSQVEGVPQQKFEIIQGEATIESVELTTDRQEAVIHASGAATVRINSAPFPAWTLYVDGKKQSVQERNDGIYFTLDTGDHTVEHVFESTTIEKVANSISLIGVFALLLGIIAIRRR